MNLKYLSSKLLILPLVAVLSACSGSGGSGVSVSDVSVRFSDAPVEGAEKVVITVDQIIFKREGEDVVVDTFTSEELNDGLGVIEVDTFQIDLLEVQGNDNRLVLDSVMLPVGEYQDLRIVVLDEDVNDSYVEEKDTGNLVPIKVPSNQLKLGAFEVAADSTQTFVIEFGLRQAMTYNPGPERYILKPRGVRVVRLEEASSIAGMVDLSEIHLDEACAAKPDSSIGNVAYLYAGHGLDVSLLGDVFIREDSGPEAEFDPSVPDDIIAPVVATDINGDTGGYLFSYLLPGNYTLALSCLAENDHPVIYDGLVIPMPEDLVLELTVEPETHLSCDLPGLEGCGVELLDEQSLEN